MLLAILATLAIFGFARENHPAWQIRARSNARPCGANFILSELTAAGKTALNLAIYSANA
jgi:hypothetical protein